MSIVCHVRQCLHEVKNLRNLFRINDWALDQFDPERLRFTANLLVWAHWCLGAVCLFQLVYRPYYGPTKYTAYALMFVFLMGCNAIIHYRLLSKRSITWGWVLTLSATEMAVYLGLLAISDGFSHYFLYLLFYPSLAFMALLVSSFKFNMLWVTIVASTFSVICLTVGDGLDFDAREEKPMLMRIVVMYAIVVTVNLVARYERTRWREAVERERAVHRESAAFSQAVHDTVAQTAFMVGLGIDTAKAQAGNANPELAATLDATSRLSKSTIWELRQPINRGGIYEGWDLGRAIRSHAASFTNITSVAAEVTQTGVEPPLSMENKGLLFSIAHNALTNVYRHAEAGRVTVHLAFGEEEITLSVSDDGIGLPPDYAERGRGFSNMEMDARRLGGHLVVHGAGAMGGTTVSCVIPVEPKREN